MKAIKVKLITLNEEELQNTTYYEELGLPIPKLEEDEEDFIYVDMVLDLEQIESYYIPINNIKKNHINITTKSGQYIGVLYEDNVKLEFEKFFNLKL